MMNTPPIVRFAPSPTGFLHVGNARAAIFNWLFAQKYGGKMLLRIEDTDVERSRTEYLDSIVNSIKWLQLNWNGEMVLQSKRMEVYHQVATKLLAENKAYFCQCDAQLLDNMRQLAIKQNLTFTYPGTCRDLGLEGKIGTLPVRLKMPSNDSWLEFDDLIRGHVSFPREQMDDFILIRSDGTPTYNFCVVIDDQWMQITHVIRGEDHVSNTPKQLALYQTLGFSVPKFAHLPMILSPSGGRLSKRDGAVSVQDYIADGFLPAAMLNYLVRLGWSHGDQEIFSREELCKLFSLEQIGKKGAVFDLHKLEWLNEQYLKQATPNDLLNYLEQQLPHKLKELQQAWPKSEQQLKLLAIYKLRHAKLSSIIKTVVKLASRPETLDIPNHAHCFAPGTRAALHEFAQNFTQYQEASSLLAWAKELCVKHQLSLPFFAQPLRLAITGSINSPNIFELSLIFAPEEVKYRIGNLLQQLAP